MRNPAQDGSIRVGLGTGGSGMKAWGLARMPHARMLNTARVTPHSGLPQGHRATLGIGRGGKERKRGVPGGGGVES